MLIDAKNSHELHNTDPNSPKFKSSKLFKKKGHQHKKKKHNSQNKETNIIRNLWTHLPEIDEAQNVWKTWSLQTKTLVVDNISTERLWWPRNEM